jgi:hypothetical protein
MMSREQKAIRALFTELTRSPPQAFPRSRPVGGDARYSDDRRSGSARASRVLLARAVGAPTRRHLFARSRTVDGGLDKKRRAVMTSGACGSAHYSVFPLVSVRPGFYFARV